MFQAPAWRANAPSALLAETMNKKQALAATAVLLSLAWSACTSDHIKRAAYEAVYQKGCIDRTGMPNCNPEHMTFEEYGKERDRLMAGDTR